MKKTKKKIETVHDVEEMIAGLVKEFGHAKVNLDRGHGSEGNGEGVWTVPATAKDNAINPPEVKNKHDNIGHQAIPEREGHPAGAVLTGKTRVSADT
jgi:hypothetical protein